MAGAIRISDLREPRCGCPLYIVCRTYGMIHTVYAVQMCSANLLRLGTACKRVVRVTVGHTANVKRTLVPLNRRSGGQHRRPGLDDLEER